MWVGRSRVYLSTLTLRFDVVVIEHNKGLHEIVLLLSGSCRLFEKLRELGSGRSIILAFVDFQPFSLLQLSN